MLELTHTQLMFACPYAIHTHFVYDGIRKLCAPFGIAEMIKYIIGNEEIQQQQQQQQQ